MDDQTRFFLFLYTSVRCLKWMSKRSLNLWNTIRSKSAKVHKVYKILMLLQSQETHSVLKPCDRGAFKLASKALNVKCGQRTPLLACKMRSKYYVKKEEKRKEILCVSIIFKPLVFATNLNIKKNRKRGLIST